MSGAVALNLPPADRLRIERVVGEVENNQANIHGVRTLLYDGLDYKAAARSEPRSQRLSARDT